MSSQSDCLTIILTTEPWLLYYIVPKCQNKDLWFLHENHSGLSLDLMTADV